MDFRLLILSLACVSCLAPVHSELLVAKLLAKKAIGVGAAVVKKAALVGGAAIAGALSGPQNPDCLDGSAQSLIDSKKKFLTGVIDLKKQFINGVLDKKKELIEGVPKPDKVVVVEQVPPVLFEGLPPWHPAINLPNLPPRVVEFPARPVVEYPHPLVEYPHRVVEHEVYPHPVVEHEVFELPPPPPHFVDAVADFPPRPVFPPRLHPVLPPLPYLPGGPVIHEEHFPIRKIEGDCL